MGRNSGHVDASASAAGLNTAPTLQPQTKPDSSFGPNGVWYFAYGSNMNPNTFEKRRQVTPLESKPAVLRGWKLSFRMLGLPYIEPGFATIERADGVAGGRPQQRGLPAAAAAAGGASSSTVDRWESEVHGVMHRISVADWVQVMATEGVGAGRSGYRVVEVELTQYDGRRMRALTLEGQPPSLHSASRPVSPSARYLNLLRDGARHHGIDPEYITYLDSLKPYDGGGWTAAVGRSVALAVAVPLALPLLPPVFLLRMARNKSRDAAKQQQKPKDNGRAGEVNGDGAVTRGSDEPSSTLSDCNSAADCSEAASKAAAATATATDEVPVCSAAMTSATQPAAATVTLSMSASALTHGSLPPPADGGGAGELPPQLLRPPLVLPAVASGYIRAIQYVTWVVHDVLAATPLGSGSSSSSNGGARQ